MVQQLSDSLIGPDGGDVDSELAWVTTPAAGKFTYYNSTYFPDSNGIPGCFQKPPTGGPDTGANLPRAFLSGGVSPFTELKASCAVRVRPSGYVAPNYKWPSTGNVDLEAGVIIRASGTDFATKKWYEIGIQNVDNQTTGSMVIRRINAGVSTELATATFAVAGTAGFKFPAFGTSGAQYNNAWATIQGNAETIGAMVRLTAKIEVAGGVYALLVFDDASSDRIVTPGFCGFWATGKAATAFGGVTPVGSLWIHFSAFLFTADDLSGGLQPPPDATQSPDVATLPDYTSISIANEETFGLALLVPKPDGILDVTKEFETRQKDLETGHRWTSSKFTEGRQRYRLRWTNLNTTDSATLETFFIDHAAIPFKVEIPNILGGTYTEVPVAFVTDSLLARYSGKGVTLQKSFEVDVLEVIV